jgi:integrase
MHKRINMKFSQVSIYGKLLDAFDFYRFLSKKQDRHETFSTQLYINFFRFSLQKDVDLGHAMKLLTKLGSRRTLKLLNNKGEELTLFTQFRDELYNISKLAPNTIVQYLDHVVRFIEFIFACTLLQSKYGASLSYIFPTYEKYLLGNSRDKPGISSLARELTGRTRNAQQYSLVPIEAALKRFLWFSSISCDRSLGLESYLDGCLRTRPFTFNEIKSQRAKAEAYGLLKARAAAISGATRYENLFHCTKQFDENHDQNTWQPAKAIASDKTDLFIDSLPTYRDQAIACAKLAFGLRGSEVLGLTDADINADTREIRCVDNRSLASSEADADKYGYKGRDTPETMGHDPWLGRFFKFLELYERFERVPNVGHSFCFQILHGENRGKPLYTAHRSSANRIFHRAAKKAGVELPPGIAEHSMRHHYGVYTRHDAPTLSGNGFPELVTQTYMGHKKASSTRKYTKKSHRDWIDTANEIQNSSRPSDLLDDN